MIINQEKTRTLKVKLISDNSNKEKLYEFVNIGTQKWMSKNLEVGHYRNGDPIPHVQDPNEWSKLKTGAWCYYKNDKENGQQFGKLYNWYAVNDIRGLAPKGYHIPSEVEWNQLNDYLGEKAGYKLKTKNGWIENGNGSNESKFSAKSTGYRYADASRFAYGYTCWWSSDESIDVAYYRYVGFDINELGKAFNYKGYGLSVRCIKDNDQ